MKIEELEELRNSNEAPFNHQEYTLWLHNKIVDMINYDLWKFREQESNKFKSSYAACTNILNIKSLKRI